MHDIQKLQNGEFYLFGLLCCVGISKRCADPRCFLTLVIKIIFLGTSTKQVSSKEIPDLEIQLKLQTIADVKMEDQFQNIVDKFPDKFWFGFTRYQFCYQFYGEERIYTANYSTFLLSMCSEEMRDFKRGLEQYGLYSILSEHFAHASKKFSLSQNITSTEIIKLFQTVLYSDASADDTKMYHLMYAVHQVLGNCKALFIL